MKYLFLIILLSIFSYSKSQLISFLNVSEKTIQDSIQLPIKISNTDNHKILSWYDNKSGDYNVIFNDNISIEIIFVPKNDTILKYYKALLDIYHYELNENLWVTYKDNKMIKITLEELHFTDNTNTSAFIFKQIH